MSGQLKGRVALVTGASRNIGRAIALRLAAEGCDIVVHVAQDTVAGAETVALLRAEGVRAELVLGDLSQPDAVPEIGRAAISAFGRLDILVNNAAIRPESSFADLSFDGWRDVMAVGLDAPFLLSQTVLAALSESDCASIVNIGGLTGHTGARNRAHVITAKAGLVGLTKAMAHDLAERGITVNCVSPGLIETDRSGPAGSAPAHHASRTNLLGRRGTACDVAEAVTVLCLPSARYMTGQTVHVNGGAYLP